MDSVSASAVTPRTRRKPKPRGLIRPTHHPELLFYSGKTGRPGYSPEIKEKWLAAFLRHQTVAGACVEVGVSYRVARDWLQNDKGLKEQYQLAKAIYDEEVLAQMKDRIDNRTFRSPVPLFFWLQHRHDDFRPKVTTSPVNIYIKDATFASNQVSEATVRVLPNEPDRPLPALAAEADPAEVS